MSTTPTNSTSDIPLPPLGGSLTFRAEGTEIEFIGGRVIVNKGTVEQPNISAKAAFAKALKTGDLISDGLSQGWIYCEGSNLKPFLVAPKDDGRKWWSKAKKLAEKGAASLPTLSQLEAIYHSRDVGALKGTFDTCSLLSQSNYWSSTRFDEFSVYALDFHNGSRAPHFILDRRSVRLVRPYIPA